MTTQSANTETRDARTARLAGEHVRVSRGRSWFAKAATKVSDASGSAWTFALVVALIIAWAVTGPLFSFSDTWQLGMNTVSSIVTFLMVFLIQNAQNRDAKATQLKLDELIRAAANARNQFIAAEDEPEEHLEHARQAVREAKELVAEERSANGEPARKS